MRKLIALTILFTLTAFPATAQLPNRALLKSVNPAINNHYAGSNELLCLSMAVYKEAKASTLGDKHQVAITLINRTKDEQGRFKKTICGAFYERGQFTVSNTPPREMENWKIAQEVALRIIDNPDKYDQCPGSTYFYAAYLKTPPSWANVPKHRKCRIGGHVYVIR